MFIGDAIFRRWSELCEFPLFSSRVFYTDVQQDLIPRDVVGPSFDNFPYRQPSQKKPVRLPVGAYPTPKGGNQDWDIIVTGRLTEKASRVWDSIKDPR